MMPDSWVAVALIGVPVVLAITLHEAAHGYVARVFGDPTAWILGRVSVNPLRHVDLVGTVLVPCSLFVVAKLSASPVVLFGWAKPVPVDFQQLRRPKQDMLWVAGAGPAANLVMMVFWAVMMKFARYSPGSELSGPLAGMASYGMEVNAILMVVNLIPLLPLDGGRMAFSLLPRALARPYARLEPFGLPLLLMLFLFGSTFRQALAPLVAGAVHTVSRVFGV